MNWIGWMPKGRIVGDLPKCQPSKPTEPSSDGFVGSCSGDFQKIASETPPRRDYSEPLERLLKGNALELYTAAGERLFIVSDDEDAAKLAERRGIIYTAAEARRIGRIADQAIVAEVHKWKRDFDGCIREVKDSNRPTNLNGECTEQRSAKPPRSK